MRRVLILPLVLLAALAAVSLAACGGGSREYKGDEHIHDKWKVEWDRCLWDVTHKAQEDGSYVELQVPDDKLDSLADQCMQQKGYSLKTKDDEKKKKGWFW